MYYLLCPAPHQLQIPSTAHESASDVYDVLKYSLMV